MSDEHSVDWTPNQLKVLLDRDVAALEQLTKSEIGRVAEQLDADVERLEEALKAQQHAVELLGHANQVAQDKFEANVAARFVQVNEFRSALEDLQKLMSTRRDLEAAENAIAGRLDNLVKDVSELRSRIDVGPLELRALQALSDQEVGRRSGVSSTTVLVIALGGLLIGAAGLVISFIVISGGGS